MEITLNKLKINISITFIESVTLGYTSTECIHNKYPFNQFVRENIISKKLRLIRISITTLKLDEHVYKSISIN